MSLKRVKFCFIDHEFELSDKQEEAFFIQKILKAVKGFTFYHFICSIKG